MYQYRVRMRNNPCPEAYSNTITIVVDPTTVPGSVTGGTTICHNDNSGLLTLEGYTGNIIRWEYSINGGSSWTTIAHTGSTYTATNLAAGGGNTTVLNYLFRAVVQSGVCTIENSGSTTVTVYPTTVGGTVNGAKNEICYNEPNTGQMTLSGNIGSVVKWQKQYNSTAGAWIDIANTALTYTDNTPLTAGTWYYRAVVQSGTGCAVEYSVPHDIVVHPRFESAQLSGAASICAGAATNLSITMTGGAGNYTVNYTRSFNGGPAVPQPQITGYTSDDPFTTGNLDPGTYVYTITSVVDANGCYAESNGTPITVIVGTEPSTATLTGSGDVCDGTESFINSTITGGAPDYTFTYTVFDGTTTTPYSISYVGDGSAISLGTLPVGSYTVTITGITDNCGANIPPGGIPASYLFNVNPIPDISSTTTNAKPICNGEATAITLHSTVANTDFSWSVTNISPSVAVTGYSSGSRNAGNGYVIAQNLSHSHTGPVTVTYTITSNGPGATDCPGNTITRDVVVNPVPQVNVVSSQVVCNGGSTTAINFSTTNTGGVTSYNWTNDTPGIGIGSSGSGNIGSFTATNTTTAPIVATITVTPMFGYGGTDCEGDASTQKTFTITINPTVAMNAVANQVVCDDASTTAITFGTNYSGGSGTVSYAWTNSEPSIGLASSGVGNIPVFMTKNDGTSPITATITVTPTLTNGGASCPGTPTSFTITVNPTVTVDAISDETLCVGASSTSVVFASTGFTGGTITYNWTNSNPDIGLGAGGTNASGIPSFAATNTTMAPISGTITVTPTFSNGGEDCVGTPEEYIITVNPTVTANNISDRIECNGATVPSLAFGTNYTGTTGTVSYEWSNNNTTIGLGSGGTSTELPSFTATNTGTAPVTATITVTPTLFNKGEYCQGIAETFTITVNPTVVATPLGSQIVCNTGATAEVIFGVSAHSGGTVTYRWSNDNEAIGLAASGSGATLPSFTATNGTTAPITGIITVTPEFTNGNGGGKCDGTPTTFSITVNPTVSATALTNQVICNGGTTTDVTFGVSSYSGGTVTYRWENNNTAIGLAASGTGTGISSFTVDNNPGNAPAVATITVYPIFQNSGGGPTCEGMPTSFTISVNPTVSANTITDQIVCNNGATTAVTFGVSAHSGGTVTYRWENDNTAINLVANGTGTGIASFSATNGGTSPIVGNITVTPVFTNSSGGPGCDGTPTTFSIMVNPTAQVNDIASEVVCNGDNTTAVVFTTDRTGGTTTYDWSINAAIGLDPTTGSGNFPSFIATNAGSSPITATVTVTPKFTAGGEECSGPSKTFTITVNPTAQANDPGDRILCWGEASGLISFSTVNSGGTTTYTWTNSNTDIGLAGSGSGNILSFTAANTTTAPITGTVTITPIFTNAGKSCSGPTTQFDITVNPRAQVDDPADLTRCNGEGVPEIVFTTQNTGGTTTYSWTNSLPSIGLAASGNGNISAFNAVNNGTATVTATITVTPHYTNASGGATCDGPAQTFTITVHPTPMLSTPLTPGEICSNNNFVYNPASATASTAFSWTRGALPANVTAAGPASGSDGISDLLRNFGSTTQTVEYTYTLTANGCVNTQVVTATVKPEPVVSDQNPIICSGQSFIWRILLENFAYPDVTFTWPTPTTSPGVTGGTARTVASNADMSDTFVNTSGSDGTATYTVTPYYNGCPGDPKDIVVTIGSQPVLADLDAFACSNTATGLTLGVAPGSSMADRYYVTSIVVDPSLIPAAGNATTLTMSDDPAGVTANYLANDSFLNTSGSDKNVVYTVRPSLGTECLGDAKTITITVRPQPVIQAGQVATVCSDEAINYEILLDPTNTPAGTTFSWNAPTMSDGSIQGTAVSGLAADPDGTFHITDALHNSTGAQITATYYVTPTSAFGCEGVEMPIVITINPEPITSAIIGDPVLCEGAINKVYSVANHAGSTYQWGVTSGLNKIVDANMYFIAVEAVGGHISSPDTVWVVEATSSTGCVGDTVYMTVNVVDVIPGVPVSGPAEVCLYDTATYSVPHNASSVYSWVVPAGAVILTDPSLHTIDVLFNVALSGTAGGISVHETTNGACTTDHITTYVTVHPLPTVYNLTSPPAYCDGGDVSITLSGSQIGVMYQLYKDGVPEDAPLAGTGAALVWSGKEVGTYTAIATNVLTTCVQVMNGAPSPIVNTVNGGKIAAVQAICPGSSPEPFTSVAPGVGAGSITYQWQKSNDNFVSDINNIAGATSEIYAPVSLGSDTWFRRMAISTVVGPTGTSVCQAYSDTIYIDAIVFDPGSVTEDQTICDNGIPAPFGSVTPTGDGVFTYQWQYSNDGFNFNNIVGAVDETYTPSTPLTQDTWYRRQVTSTLLGVPCVKFTPAVKVTVINFLPGSIGSDQVICMGSTPAPFTGIAASGDGTFTYQWQYSTATSGWADVTAGVGATSANYAPAALTENTWFRRVVTARDASDPGVACVDITNIVLVSVIDFDPGTITGDQTICEGSTVTVGFTGTPGSSNTADTYNYTYQWQKHNGSSFVDIIGATGADYTPVEALTEDTRYRRVVTATYGSRQCQSVTNEITVTVNNILAGTVTGTQTICEDTSPTVLNYTGNTGEGGATITHQWEYSTDNWTTSMPIGTVDDMTLQPGPLSVDTRFRVVATSERNGVTCTSTSNDILVTVINFAPGNIAADQTICEGSYPTVLSGDSPSGDGVFSYRWYQGVAADPNAAIPVLTFSPLPSSNSETWNPGILTEDRWYVREVTSTLNGVSCVKYTDTVWVRVNNLDPGSMVTGDYIICDGANMTDIDATAAIADGTVTYMWQISSDGTNFSDTGVTTEDYPATAITDDTWFRRMVTSTVTSPVTKSCSDYTGTVKVTVINFVPGAISSDQTICMGSAPMAFTSVAASGDGVKTYQWQDSTATSGWTNVASGGTGATYSAGVLSENTWFRRIATATVGGVSCHLVSNVLSVTVIDFDPGTIYSDQVICEGEIPALLSGTAASDNYPAYGYAYAYQWQSRTATGSYVNIPLATDLDYTPTEELYEDMYYRRKVTATVAGAQCVLYTNELHVTVNNFTVGSISAPQTICENTAPATLAYSGTLAGGDGESYDLVWQYKTVNDLDYIDDPAATADTYDPGVLTEDTWFRLKVVSNIGVTNSCPKYTNEIKVTVNNFDPGTIGNDQVICANTTAATLGSVTAASGDGMLAYLWYSSADGSTWSSTGVNTESYSPGVLANDMWYYRSVTSTLNAMSCTEDNLPVYIQVNNVDAGTITGGKTICEGGDGGTVSSNGDGSLDGAVAYQWYESVDGVAFTEISGATADSYSPGILTSDRWYKLRVSSTVGANVCHDETDAVRITVINFVPGTIGSDQVICHNTVPATFTGTAPSGDGSFTYRWESSADGVTYTSIVPAAEGSTYTSPALTADTWFRRVTISTLNGESCEHESNAVQVNVILFDQGSIGGDQVICEGSVPLPITSVADASGEGLLQYQWQVSTDGVTFSNITGATNSEYQPGALIQDAWYRRVVTSTVDSRTCTYITNTVKVTVNNILTVGSVTGSQTICEGDTPSGFTSVAGTVDGVLSYQWYSSLDGVNYSEMAGETSELFTPVALTQDTWYKRHVVSTMGLLVCDKETGTVKVTVNNFDPGTIGNDQVICANTTAATLGSVTAASGDGMLAYLWYSSADGSTWSSTGVNTESYSPGVLANDMWYYRSVTSTLNAMSCTEDNLPVYIQVNNVDAGTITGGKTICEGGDGGTVSSNGDGSLDGAVAYQWYESVDGVAFTEISGATADSYSPGILTSDRWYKLRVSSTVGANVCHDETDAVRITVINFVPGTIGSDQVICHNTVPATFTGTAPSGDGSFTYRWESSADGVTYTSIVPAAEGSTYTSPALTADTWFRRVTISTLNGESCEHESNAVQVNVILFDQGSIGGDQVICEGSVPLPITSVADASGEGLLQYQWQVSTDGVTFSNITGATNSEYQPGALIQDAWYRRVVTSTVDSRTCTYITNTVKVTVNNILTVGSVTGSQTICEGDTPSGFTSVAGTVDGVLSYQWYSSLDGVNYSEMAGETSELFTPVALTQDTWYKRHVVSTMGLLVCDKETGTVKVTVNNFDPGSIAGDQTICLSMPASMITSVAPTGDGIFSYAWYSSTVSETDGFAPVSGASSETYYPGAPAQDTWYYREVTSTLNGVTCVENTNVVKVTVNNMTAGAIGNDETMCSGTVPANITLTTAPYFDGGTPSYQWMISNDNFNFTNIPGATGDSYQPPALTQDTWYRLTVTSTLNGVACSNFTNVTAKLVNNVSGGSIISDQAICYGGDPVPFVSTLNGSGDGSISYRWEQSYDSISFTAIAGTNSPVYDPPALDSDRYFRRVTISDLGGLVCEAVSNTVKVTVNTVLGGAIGTSQEICFGEAPAPFTNTDPGSGTGTTDYRWYRSSDGVYFSLITGEDQATYAPGVLYADAWYKRELVSNLNGNICTAESNILHITVHPRPVAVLSGGATICPGESTDLTVDIMVGTGPYEVELTSSADGSVVTVSGYDSGNPIPVSPTATTTYTLTGVTDAHGCAVTPATYPSNLSGAALVTVRLAPVIVTPPVDVTKCEYGVASFSVVATGTEIAYQWYENGVALSDGGVYYGVNSATLNIYGVLRDMDGNVYNVVASNCGTNVSSDIAMLTVNTAPEIMEQPDNVTICSTQGTSFEVVAQGTAVTYQWQINRQDGLGMVNVVDDANFSGSNSSVLTLTDIPGSFNNYIFRVRLDGACGSSTYSNFVALRVNVPPTVTRNPVDAALCDGAGTITFLGGGLGMIDSLRWQVSTDGVTWNDIYDNSNYSGTMTQQLTIIDAPLGFDGYRYRLALKAVCATVYTDAATLTVNTNPVVDFSAVDPIAACGGVATVIDGNPTGGSGIYTQHTWTGDVGPLSNYSVQSPTFLTSVAGNYILTYKVQDSNGCVAEGDVEVIVEMPDASYTMNTTQGCTPTEVTFTKDMSGVDHWEWDFGDGTTNSSDASPVHTFTNVNATSIEYYNVKLTVWSAGGCSAEFTRMVTVYPAVDATFTAANDSICSGTPLLFTGVTGASSYFWDFGDGVTGSGEANATHIYTNVTGSPITVTVSLTARSFYGCETMETMDITVMPVPSPQYSIVETPPYIYEPTGNTLHFVNNTGAGAWSYLWDFGDGTTSTEMNPVHTYNDLGDYDVMLTVYNELCASSVVRTVSILPRAPIASFNEIASGCSPLVIAPVNTSQETQYPGTTYLWDFGDGSYSTAENPEYTYHTDGIFRVELTVTGPGGVSSYSQVVESYASPNAYMEVLPTAVFANDEAVRCFNLSIGADYYLWEFGDGDTSRLEEPSHKYMEEGVYDITLWAYSENGCSDRYVLSPGVTVEPSGELVFATVFRPSLDGPTTSDGGISGTPIILPEGGEEIDRFFFPPIREKVTGYKLQIFNRLGVLIFQSNDVNVPWDGYYRGTVCPQGVYVWYVEGKYSNGEPFRQVGDITLLH
mgnify:CR=1 FL=1